jgi:hypothetical protein
VPELRVLSLLQSNPGTGTETETGTGES